MKIGFRIVLLFLFSGFGSAVHAQSENFWGFAYGGAGVATDGNSATGLFLLGAGAEGLMAEGFGFTAGLSYVTPFEDFDEGIGLFTPGLMYAFNRSEKTVPFLNGGYSLLFRSGSTANGIFFGGGVNRWIGDRWGLRFEARDNIVLQGETFHVVEIRIGLTFR